MSGVIYLLIGAAISGMVGVVAMFFFQANRSSSDEFKEENIKNKNKKHLGEMSFYAMVISVCLIMFFSPLFFYIQSRQQISTTKEEIEISLKSYSKIFFNELYDDTKELNTNGDMYKALSESDQLKMALPFKMLTELNFTQTQEEQEKNEFSRNNTKIGMPLMSLEKISNNEYLFRISYKITQKTFSFDNSVLVFSDDYVAECRVYRDENYMDTPQVPNETVVNGSNAFAPSDVIEKWDISEKTDTAAAVYNEVIFDPTNPTITPLQFSGAKWDKNLSNLIIDKYGKKVLQITRSDQWDNISAQFMVDLSSVAPNATNFNIWVAGDREANLDGGYHQTGGFSVGFSTSNGEYYGFMHDLDKTNCAYSVDIAGERYSIDLATAKFVKMTAKKASDLASARFNGIADWNKTYNFGEFAPRINSVILNFCAVANIPNQSEYIGTSYYVGDFGFKTSVDEGAGAPVPGALKTDTATAVHNEAIFDPTNPTITPLQFRGAKWDKNLSNLIIDKYGKKVLQITRNNQWDNISAQFMTDLSSIAPKATKFNIWLAGDDDANLTAGNAKGGFSVGFSTSDNEYYGLVNGTDCVYTINAEGGTYSIDLASAKFRKLTVNTWQETSVRLNGVADWNKTYNFSEFAPRINSVILNFCAVANIPNQSEYIGTSYYVGDFGFKTSVDEGAGAPVPGALNDVHAYYCTGGRLYVTGTGFIRSRSSYDNGSFPWYKYRYQIKEVYFLDNVYNVPAWMFVGFSNLKKVEFNKTMCYLGNAAFNGTRVDSIYIPGHIKEIGSNCFNSVTIINTDVNATAFKENLINSLKVYNHSNPFTSAEVIIDGINNTRDIYRWTA